MSECISIPDYNAPIGTSCMVCGKEIDLGYSMNALVPAMCEECKKAIKFAKKLMNDQVESKND